MGQTPARAMGAPAFIFADIQTGDIFWLASDHVDPRVCEAEFGPLNPDGVSRTFDCLNGGWDGVLTQCPDGRLELLVCAMNTTYTVFITARQWRAADYPVRPDPDGDIPY